MGSTLNFFDKKRKWSIIKDNILEWYLTPYLAKITATNKGLVMIDCFAGKGKFDDGSLGSPLIIGNKVNDYISKGKNIKSIFIEKKYSEELEKNLSECKHYEIKKGTFEEHFEKILSSNQNVNIFLYVDPYGIKCLDFNRFEKMKKSNFHTYEMLMNFNSFGFLREGCRLLKYKYEIVTESKNDEDEVIYEVDKNDTKNSIENMNCIANGEYWQGILIKYNNKEYDMFKAEEIFVNEYMIKLDKLFKYTISIPVKLNTKNIPKYRMIFGTNHHDGIILMCDNMNNQWKKILEEQRQGQIVLFEFDYPDCSIIKDFNIENCINEVLKKHVGVIKLEDLLCKLIDKQGIAHSKSEYSAIIQNMEKSNKIVVHREPKYTPTGRLAKSLDYSKYKIGVKLNL